MAGNRGPRLACHPANFHLEARRNYIIGQLNQVPANFAITTSGGNDFSTDTGQLILEGTAPVQIKTITINGGVAIPRMLTTTPRNVRMIREFLDSEH